MFQIKGKMGETNVHIVAEDAADLVEAVEMGVAAGIQEFYAVNLNTSIKEVIRNDKAEQGIWYMGTIRETIIVEDPDGKRKPKAKKVRYNILLQADSIEEATAIFSEQLQQGYDAIARSIKETDIFDVICHNPQV